MRTREPLTLQPSPIALIRASGGDERPSAAQRAPARRAHSDRARRLRRDGELDEAQARPAVSRESARGQRSLPGSCLCGHSAAALYGISLSRPSDPVHLLGSTGTARVSGPVRFVVSRDERDVRHVDGILVTSVPDTIVDAVRDSTPGIGLAYADMLLRHSPESRLTACARSTRHACRLAFVPGHAGRWNARPASRRAHSNRSVWPSWSSVVSNCPSCRSCSWTKARRIAWTSSGAAAA